MRIIAGEFRSRMLEAPAGLSTRPMPDRVRESIFSMLGERVVGAAAADLFAGTGSMGLEALSRGAATCLFVEQSRGVAEVLRRNIAMLGVERRCTVVVGDALGMSIPARCPGPLDLAFMDPPFPLVREAIGWDRVRAQAAALGALLAADGFLILRTPQPHAVESPAAAEAAAVVTPRALRRRKYQRDRRRWEDEPISRASEPRELEDGDDDQREVIVHAEEHPASVRTPADLSVAGCRGPETHVYGKSAVHWYMRAASGGGSGVGSGGGA